ncbi:MAG: hypothetical protein HXS54_06080 [Theionarchaea archaeon]|nr:hypothetical protein [Theionarchaea archaeon]DBA34827.1 TPA_asm: hypothetical protein vir521_00033 [Caudoviricetes sp. vir521]
MKTKICDDCKNEDLTIEEWEDMLKFFHGEDYSPCASCNKNYFTLYYTKAYTTARTSIFWDNTHDAILSRLTEYGLKKTLQDMDWSKTSNVKITFTHRQAEETTDVTKDFKHLIKEMK